MDSTTAIVVCLFGVLSAATTFTALLRGGPRNNASNGSQIVTGPAGMQTPANGGWARAREIQVLEDAIANAVRAKIELETAAHLKAAAADGRYNGDLDGAVTQHVSEANDAIQATLARLVTVRAGERDSAPADIETIYSKVAGSGNGHEA